MLNRGLAVIPDRLGLTNVVKYDKGILPGYFELYVFLKVGIE